MTHPLVETHPLPPFLPPHARLLMLGSFPPPRARWKMDFYYPNLQNDMWRIFGVVFFNDANHFLLSNKKGFAETKLRDFLWQKGIAISDTAQSVIRLQNNAADKYLQIQEEVDLAALLRALPQCETLLTTGEKATATLLRLTQATLPIPAVGAQLSWRFENRDLHLFRLPSSSRAYPLALAQKAAIYRQFFKDIGLLTH